MKVSGLFSPESQQSKKIKNMQKSLSYILASGFTPLRKPQKKKLFYQGIDQTKSSTGTVPDFDDRSKISFRKIAQCQENKKTFTIIAVKRFVVKGQNL